MITVDGRALLRELVAAIRTEPALGRELIAALEIHAPEPRYLTIRAYAERRAIGQSTVRAAIADGRLASITIGRSRRIPADAVIGAAPTTKNGDATERAELRLGLVRGGRT